MRPATVTSRDGDIADGDIVGGERTRVFGRRDDLSIRGFRK
jgi:hypothetical protein